MNKPHETGNKILAHYMGVEYTEKLNYREDWNLLMPVWVKLTDVIANDMGNMVTISFKVLQGDSTVAWSYIVGYVNKHILTEEEYLKFKYENKEELNEII